MSNKVESAELILKLYELRREEVLRKARAWLIGQNFDSVQDIYDIYTVEHAHACEFRPTGTWPVRSSIRSRR